MKLHIAKLSPCYVTDRDWFLKKLVMRHEEKKHPFRTAHRAMKRAIGVSFYELLCVFITGMALGVLLVATYATTL